MQGALGLLFGQLWAQRWCAIFLIVLAVVGTFASLSHPIGMAMTWLSLTLFFLLWSPKFGVAVGRGRSEQHGAQQPATRPGS
jgi:multisubunit Na+/H+ antiporter MnhG subunit